MNVFLSHRVGHIVEIEREYSPFVLKNRELRVPDTANCVADKTTHESKVALVRHMASSSHATTTPNALIICDSVHCTSTLSFTCVLLPA